MSSFRPEPGESRRQFEEEVFPAELRYVEDRRRSVGDDRDSLSGPVEVSTDNQLVGLALSGGGIRSASFSLGFLQSLPSRLFRRIDYLSTVSGGGFIGSSITALMANAFYRRQPGPQKADEGEPESGVAPGEPGAEGSTRGPTPDKPEPADFPFPLTRTEQEPAALSHLRNNSNYMAPGGLGDIFRLLAVLLRGIILNSLSLAPFLLLVCLIVLLIYGQQLSDRARFDDQVQQIDALLGRYYGNRLAKQPELDPLLEVLEAEALLRIEQGKSRGDVLHQLRPALSFGQGTADDLITGNGTLEAPYRLTPGARREDLARVLLKSDVLQPDWVIEEVDLLARVLEQKDYRHLPEPSEKELSKAKEDQELRRRLRRKPLKMLIRALVQLDWIRPGTGERELIRFLESHWSPRLKPVLQVLYNAEYLREEAVRDLVREELGRAPYYAYGWYEGRVGDPFAERWCAEGNHTGDLDGMIESELDEIAEAFGEDCLKGTGDALPGCLRPKTRPADVRRLLEFEELLGGHADEASESGPRVVTWRSLKIDLARLQQKDKLEDVVEALYFGEYLREQWVLKILPDEEPGEEPWELLSDKLTYLDEGVLLRETLVLEPETVCGDLVELAPDWNIGFPDCLSLDFLDDDDGAAILEKIWPLLDKRWVDRHLYVYHYGWHRSLRGKAYPGAWCGGATASRGAAGCLAASDESWKALSRALRDPSRWNPNRLVLPLTWVAIRASLGWVLLFPLLLFAARAIYRRRQEVVGRETNPLRALLSSDQSLNWRNLYERTFGVLLAIILGVALIELLPYAVHHFHYLSLRGQSSRTLAIGAVSLLITALGGPALALLERFGRTVALILLALAGPLLLLTLFVYTMEYAVYFPPPLVDTVLGPFSSVLKAFVNILDHAVYSPAPHFGAASSLLAGDLTLWFLEGGRRLLSPAAAWSLFALASALSIGLALVIDINGTSLHGLYRDRIAKAFMVGLDTEGDVEPEEDLALAQICPAGSGAPYHLINVALNLQGSGDRSLRGRASDFLFFSRDHVGGPRTGFCRTRDLAAVFPYAHLASAMAVSGAAVSPNMGRYKSGTLAVLMSLLNTRLGLWMPHPGAVRGWFGGKEPSPGSAPLLDFWHRFRLRAPATLLLRELAGAVGDQKPVVNVSDGGHIENTGALELLRRRCREIVIVDGEADPAMAFGGLATLQRIARIDMGIEIEIDLAPLRLGEDGLSRSRSMIGVIRYPARRRRGGGRELVEETGRLLYVKLAMTGAEGETVAEYRARNRDFPHQSTGDQAFDEGQFEAYRRLGQLAGQEVFGAGDNGPGEESRTPTDPGSE